jgi:hypothetical protein
VARRLGAQSGGEGATVASPASEFDRHLAPSIRQPHTRADYWRAWRLVVTCGFGRASAGMVTAVTGVMAVIVVIAGIVSSGPVRAARTVAKGRGPCLP